MLLSKEVMDMSAALYNDTQKAVVTYTVQLPYLNMALNELQEEFELNNVPVTNNVSSPAITLAAGVTRLDFTTVPSLPSDLIEIRQLWERNTGIDPYTEMFRRDFLPHYLDGTVISQFIYWAWNNNGIDLLPSTNSNDLKMDYVKSLFVPFIDIEGMEVIPVINSKSYLGYKTAALMSQFIGENPTRAAELNALAGNALERSLGITTKTRQAIVTRRRPFRASYRGRGNY